MFGTYRTILALMVLVAHVFGPYQLGIYAVFGFYVLSGLLMTTIMHKTYGYNLKGQLRYLTNRFLRIYPAYWLTILISLIGILIIGENVAQKYHDKFLVPTNFEEILRNILIVFSHESKPQLSPSAWALSVEIFFYLVICFGLSKTYRRTLTWLIVSIVYTLLLIIFDHQWEDRYFPIQAASLPFAIGSYLYFVIKENRWKELFQKQYLHPALLTVILLVNFALHWTIERKANIPLVFETGFYINLVLVASIVLGLAYGQSYPFLNKGIDKHIGDLSYPIYLLHWQIGLFVSFLILGTPYRNNSIKGAIVLCVAIPVTILISFLMVRFVDRPMDKIRAAIKPKKSVKVAEEKVLQRSH
jgi:peptidoglycan/LPS O-acetylase OafA/YrhL